MAPVRPRERLRIQRAVPAASSAQRCQTARGLLATAVDDKESRAMILEG